MRGLPIQVTTPMSTTSALRAVRAPDTAAGAPDRLAQLRAEIDRLDAQLLHALEQRIALAREIGAHKPPVEGQPTLGFRPDREAAVVGGLLARADPSMHALVQGVWREVMSAGLAAQGPMTVAVWRGPERRVGLDAARRRFGASARYARAADPGQALADAARGDTLAVLALEADRPWWLALAPGRDGACEDLWVCEALSATDDAREPDALALGRLPPGSLAPGREVRVTRCGGDGGWSGPPDLVLATAEGWRLTLAARRTDGPLDVSARDRGVVGRV